MSTPKVKIQFTVQAGFFDWLFPKNSSDPKAKELVDELLQYSKTGPNNQVTKFRIMELVEELRPYSINAPVKNKLFNGQYKNLYSSGKSRGFTETIDRADFVSEEKFKLLGLFPGAKKDIGELKKIGRDSYTVTSVEQESSGITGTSTKAVEGETTFKVLYLDERIRVVCPEEDSEEVYVFERVVEEEEENLNLRTGTVVKRGTKKVTKKREVEEEIEQSTPRGLFAPQRAPQPSLATIAERNVKQRPQARKRGAETEDDEEIGQVMQFKAQLREQKEQSKNLSKSIRETEQSLTPLRKDVQKLMRELETLEAKDNSAKMSYATAQKKEDEAKEELENARKALVELEKSSVVVLRN